MSVLRTAGRTVMIEDEHFVLKVRSFLPATVEGTHDQVSFWAQEGGQRTLRVDDIVDVR